MKLYLQELVNRLSQFSETLDKTSLFIDKPWVLIDENDDYHKYIFRRNGELIMSLNGHVQVGRWEYIAAAKSLLIARLEDDKILLNHAYFDAAVMVLKVDGKSNEFFILCNENLIPDLDLEKYLRVAAHRNFNIITGRLEDGRTLEIYTFDTFQQTPSLGMETAIDNQRPKDGKYRSPASGKYYEIKDGKIVRITHPTQHASSEGELLVIEQVYSNSPSIGDIVTINGKPAPSGRYRLGLLDVIRVKSGIITERSMF